MRVIGGKYKGFRFNPPAKIPARPTTDRSKESLINILLSSIGLEDKNCLDLFSGTGNIAFELASQGASQVTAVDLNFHSVTFIKETFQALGYKDFKVVKSDVFKWLAQTKNLQFDLVFADPPYDNKAIADIPDLVFANNLLASDGLLVIEHRSVFNFHNEHFKYCRDYGQSRFSFFNW